MVAFPTLSKEPEPRMWREETIGDPTIRSETESGHILTRARYTSAPKKWSIQYLNITQADKNLLDTFEAAINYGSDAFTWTNPQDDNVYSAKLMVPIQYSIGNKPDLWDASLEIMEAYPNSEDSILVETVVAANHNITTSDILMVGRLLSAGNQADGSDIVLFFEYGSDVNSLAATAYSELINVSDFETGAKLSIFDLESNILIEKDFCFRAGAKSVDDSEIGYGEIKTITSDLLGY